MSDGMNDLDAIRGAMDASEGRTVAPAVTRDDVRSLVAEIARLRERVAELEGGIREHSCGVAIGCWCPEGDDGAVNHRPGCEGPRRTAQERVLKALLDTPQAQEQRTMDEAVHEVLNEQEAGQ